MDAESKKLLEETKALSLENNKMLHKIRGIQNRQTLWSVFKFLIFIGMTLGAFYFIEPYLNKVINMYNTISGIEQKVNNSSIKNLLEKF